MSKGTTHRTVRIEDGLWQAAKEVADRNGETLSDVIRIVLTEYAKDWHPKGSDAPSVLGNAHIAICPRCRATFG